MTTLINGKITDTTEVAKLVREQLKKEFPACKFSVTCQYFSGGSELTIALMSAPFAVFAKDVDINGNPEKGDYAQLNYFQLKYDYDYTNPAGVSNGVFLTPEAWKVLKRTVEIGQAQNWDNSDLQSDYFDVNYYFDINIGKWNKAFQISK